MIGKKLTPFKFWCQKVLPTVYDDSLSYYEYLGKLNEYLNEVIEQINALTQAEEDFQEDLSAQWTAYKNGLNTEWLEYKTELTAEWNTYRTQLTEAWTTTKNYIDNYFDNLDVQEEINNKLDAMVVDGTFTTLLNNIVGDDIPTIVSNWLEANVDPVGSAVTVDKTLKISGSASDSKVVGDKFNDIADMGKTLDGNYFTRIGFVQKHIGNNLLDMNNAHIGYVYAKNNDGELYEYTNQYTGGYAGLYVEILDSSYITISVDVENTSLMYYAFTDENNVILTEALNNDPISIDSTGLTLPVPSGAKTLYFNWRSYGAHHSTKHLMVNSGQSAISYEPYYDYITIDGNRYNKATDKITTEQIANNSVTIPKTSFVESHIINMYNKDTMLTTNKMYYRYTENDVIKVHLVENQYTVGFGAIVIPLNENSNITLSTDTARAGCWYYAFTDDNDVVLSEYNDAFDVYPTGTTLSVPDGATKFYLNWRGYAAQHNNVNLMVNDGTSVIPYVPYDEYLTFNGYRYQLYEGSSNGLSVPQVYELVAGDTFEMFYKGIIKAVNIDNFYVEIICPKGKAFKKKFIYTPLESDVGTYSMTINLYNNNHEKIDSKTVTINVKSKASSPNIEKVILFVGDSLTQNGAIPNEFNRRLTGTGGTPSGDEMNNISFIGTCQTGNTKFEGYGGYSFSAYNTEHRLNSFMWITCNSHGKTVADQWSIYKDSNNVNWKLETIEENRIKIICTNISGSLPSTSGTLTWVSGGTNHDSIVFTSAVQAAGNPFWNESDNKVDFKTYVTNQNKLSLDYLYVLLGWNGGLANESVIREQVETFIDNVTDADDGFPNCKIVLLGLEVPSYDGLANNNGSSNDSLEYYAQQNIVWKLNKLYQEIAYEHSTNVSFVNIAGQFDTEHNMYESTRPVNTRNSQLETYQTNGVHPAVSGLYQIADACWRDLQHKLQ